MLESGAKQQHSRPRRVPLFYEDFRRVSHVDFSQGKGKILYSSDFNTQSSRTFGRKVNGHVEGMQMPGHGGERVCVDL